MCFEAELDIFSRNLDVLCSEFIVLRHLEPEYFHYRDLEARDFTGNVKLSMMNVILLNMYMNKSTSIR